MDNLAGLLGEIARVLHPEGKAVLVIKTNAVHDYTLVRYAEVLGAEWLDMIDRGRKANYPRLYDDDGWSRLFRQAGLEVTSRRPQITWLHAHLWDIGLRPISPFLIEMANSLPSEARCSIKARWMEVMERLIAPFCRPGLDLSHSAPPAEVVYVLAKAR